MGQSQTKAQRRRQARNALLISGGIWGTGIAGLYAKRRLWDGQHRRGLNLDDDFGPLTSPRTILPGKRFLTKDEAPGLIASFPPGANPETCVFDLKYYSWGPIPSPESEW